ncbi:LytR/AlgR family response regulator transcription factor [Mangrovibacterium diazotrophicum]|uniref:LytTR family two component transcriptional regulator n=1 Tax=Mangrovibacterium diazotrophicum TaxID=1261403 RepID=A0A419W6T6_9BACT|nr:LytTR family DNA-binding domain-containing protein [Mangrovibacterium diazotrophicum]RKD91181.1 LytTR family two component transcriptional regulator [Mangrovibacterium diazotrophicum]
MLVKAIIVDDEPLARQVILEYAKDIPNLEIVCTCPNALEANKTIKETQVDLMFLDVDMPILSGLDFLKNITHAPLVILTTAYTDYALEGYELNILDYLKKPFGFDRFFKAFQKAEEQLSLLQLKTSSQKDNAKPEYIFIKSNKKTVRVQIEDIRIIEGLGDYIKIHLKDQHLVTNLSMKKMEELLPENDFIRIHKSFIIRLDSIQAIEGNQVEIIKQKLPIGNNYRQSFNELIERRIIK